MKILSLKKIGNNVKIIFDDNEPVSIDYRIALDAGLRKNDQIDNELLSKLLLLHNKLKIKDTALKFILRRSHSEQELRNKLIKKGYQKKLIEDVIEELKSKNYINDYEFSKQYVEERFHKKRVGIYKIRSELIHKGVDRKIVDDILVNYDFTSTLDFALELARKKINTAKYKNLDKRKLKQKLFSFLSLRGFQSDIIKDVLDKLNLTEDNF